MKSHYKKIFLCMITFIALLFNSFCFATDEKTTLESSSTTTSDTTKEDSNNFNFIKAEEDLKDFLYDGSLLLYGGSFLIAVSLIGIILTLKPNKKKRKKKKKNHMTHYAPKNHSRSKYNLNSELNNK